MTASQIIANEINKNKTHLPLSGVMAYHLLSGSLTLANTEITTGFATTLYTGNGTTQSVNTGVDMDTQWGNLATERFGGLVIQKPRTAANSWAWADTINGVNNTIQSNSTNSLATSTNTLTAFTSTGFSGGGSDLVASGKTIASWVFQTTHRITGTTNHGKAYTCHYNPFTGFTMVKYDGSGIAGHEIPHHLGRKLDIVHQKITSTTASWSSYVPNISNNSLSLNLTDALSYNANSLLTTSETYLTVSGGNSNGAYTYIMYGWANSYFDESNTLIGNYEIGVYQGTGASGNKVTTRGKPAWVMIKRLDSTTTWLTFDNQRNDLYLQPNSSAIEGSSDYLDFVSDGFILKSNASDSNTSGGQYLYMVVYDNDSGSGRSKYPRATDTSTLNLNATIPFANGIDANGTKNSILVKNETVSGLTLTEGKNYIYSKNDGTYGVSSVAPAYGNVNPARGDFFNVLENKWYTSAGIAITESRNYLNAIVYADQNGQPTYVEQLPKTTYFDEVKANEFKGKNACTAWVNFDGKTTPPTIRDSYNVSMVIKLGVGIYRIYFKNEMDNLGYALTAASTTEGSSANDLKLYGVTPMRKDSVEVTHVGSSYGDPTICCINITGGKN